MTMTEVQETARPSVPIGQAVGQAEAALTALLAAVLARTGTRRETYLGLQRMTALGDGVPRETYVNDLSDWLRLSPGAAEELAAEMTRSSLLAVEDGTIRMASAGADLRETILGSAQAITASLLAPLDARDVETTIRILEEITTRARQARSAERARGDEEGRS
jgi:hypothetical protein